MDFDFNFPQFNLRNASTKEQVIYFLSNEWPLSVKQIYNKVSKESKSGISYQAVHKVIKRLEEDGTVVQNGKDYKLSDDWLFSLKKFSDEVHGRYSKTQGKYEVKPSFEGKIVMHFDDYSNFIVTTANLLEKRVLIGNGPNIGVGIFRHVLWPLRFAFSDFELFIKMTKSIPKTYGLILNDTPLDRWIKQQWLSGGFGGLRLGVVFEGVDGDVIIHGDSIIQVRYSEETKKVVDEAYKRNSNLLDIFKEYFTRSLGKKKTSIDVVLTKNSELAAVMRKQILSYFPEAANSTVNSNG